MGLLDDLTYDPQMALGMGLLSAGGNSRMPVSFGQGLGSAWGNMQDTARAGQKAKLLEQEQAMRQMQMAQMKREQDEQAAMQQAARDSFQSPAQQALMGGQGPTNEAAAMLPGLKPRFDQQAFFANLAKVNPLAAMQMQAKMKQAPIKLGADETLLDPETFQPMAQGKPKSDSIPSAIKEYNFAVRQGYKGTFEQWDRASKNAGAPKSSVVVQPDRDPFKNITALRKEFNDQPAAKAFAEVESAYKQINFALSNPSASNDLAAATKIMKMLDPGSVVRESELGMAMAATGMMDRMGNYYNMLQTGQKLTPSQREDFKKTAEGLYAAAKGSFNAKANEFREFAKTYNLNPDHVVKLSPEAPAAGSAMSGGGWSATPIK